MKFHKKSFFKNLNVLAIDLTGKIARTIDEPNVFNNLWNLLLCHVE